MITPSYPSPTAETIETFTGTYFPISVTEEPDFNLVHTLDLGHHLSQQTRFVGGCSRFYSVAEHLILTCNVLERAGFGPRLQLIGLCHDGAEFITGDVSKPLKTVLGPNMKKIEDLIQTAVWKKILGDDPELMPDASEKLLVKMVDDLLLRYESSQLMTTKGQGWRFIWERSQLPEFLVTAFDEVVSYDFNIFDGCFTETVQQEWMHLLTKTRLEYLKTFTEVTSSGQSSFGWHDTLNVPGHLIGGEADVYQMERDPQLLRYLEETGHNPQEIIEQVILQPGELDPDPAMADRPMGLYSGGAAPSRDSVRREVQAAKHVKKS